MSFLRRGKRTPAWIRGVERRRLARSRQHKAKLAAEEERLHDVAVVSNSERSVSATPSPSPPLPPPLQRPMPPPRAVSSLPLDDQQADSPAPRSQSPERADPPAPRSPSRSQTGRQGIACIAHRALLPVQDGGVRVTERATPRARQGPRLAPRRVVLPNPACRPAQGSLRLGLALGVRPYVPAPLAIAASYLHQTRGA